MNRTILLLVAAMVAVNTVTAHNSIGNESINDDRETKTQVKAFEHLDLSLTVGSTGIGFDLAMPVNNLLQVRTGATFMPKIQRTMSFGVQVGTYTNDPNLSAEENKKLEMQTYQNRFNKLNGILENILGYKVDDQVDMLGNPTFNQFKLFVDIFPFKNKKWHITAGFYLSGRKVADAYNTTYDMTSLMAVTTYNSMYYKSLAEEPLISYGEVNIHNSEMSEKFRSYGRMAMHIGDFKHDIYAKEDIYYEYSEVDPVFGEYVVDKNGREIKKGSLRFAKGEKMYNAGDAYRMVPDKDNMVRAKAIANAFKPYLGFGYGGYIDKSKRTQLSFDCGVMFWGGVPEITTHDGINLFDLDNVRSSVKRYLDIIDNFSVYPVMELRISQRLF